MKAESKLIHVSEAVIRYVTLITMIVFIIPMLLLFLFAQRIGFTEESHNPILAFLASIIVGLPSIGAFLIANSPIIYFGTILGIAFFAALSLFGTDRFTVNKLLAIMILLSIGIFAMIPYQTAIQVTDKYRMTSPTQPSFLERGLRNLQVLGEVTPCSYRLLGWEKQSLFYEEICNNQNEVYQFNPQTEDSLRIPDALSIENLYVRSRNHTEILDQFRADGVAPPEAELSVIELSLRGTALVSPNGEWLAIVAKHVYGPQDILVITHDP